MSGLTAELLPHTGTVWWQPGGFNVSEGGLEHANR
jgi:hypothetical protein